jgi:hypothetical protein
MILSVVYTLCNTEHIFLLFRLEIYHVKKFRPTALILGPVIMVANNNFFCFLSPAKNFLSKTFILIPFPGKSNLVTNVLEKFCVRIHTQFKNTINTQHFQSSCDLYLTLKITFVSYRQCENNYQNCHLLCEERIPSLS